MPNIIVFIYNIWLEYDACIYDIRNVGCTFVNAGADAFFFFSSLSNALN